MRICRDFSAEMKGEFIMEYGGLRRGEIYYVEPTYPTTGSEQRPGRPAIIVSNNLNNEHSSVVEVVYMTTRPKKDLPTHVQIRATDRFSTALCEQVHTVDIQRLSNYCGVCSEQEMQGVDIALMISLGLQPVGKRPEKAEAGPPPASAAKAEPPADETQGELIAVKAQLEMMKQMYNDLLKQCIVAKTV